MYFVGLLGFIVYTIINSVLCYLKPVIQNRFRGLCLERALYLLPGFNCTFATCSLRSVVSIYSSEGWK